MKIATWNVNSLKVRLPHLLAWLKLNPVDVIGLQELKLEDKSFPTAELEEAGYHAVCNGQKTYNGVAILARGEIAEVSRDMCGFEDEQKRVIAATVDGVRIVNVYVVNGQAVGSPKYEYKLRWMAALREYLAAELARHARLAVVGDFNVAPADEDVHDPAAWQDEVLASEPERAALRALLELGLTDCVAARPPQGNRFTWWDYRQAAFRRNMGLRIDHVFASRELAAGLVSSAIDLSPRRLERPSDHAPVVTEFTV